MIEKQLIEIVNDKIVIDAGTDWVAILALCFTIISTIGILLWQNYLRKQDEKQRIKQQNKEDEIKKWNALYPHRLKFYTDFYDTLFRFLAYCKMHQMQAKIEELQEYCSLFNKFAEDAKVLFNEDIQRRVHLVYDTLYSFLNDKFIQNIGNKNIPSSLWDGENFEDCILKRINQMQQDIKDLKLDTDLRKQFEKILTMKNEEAL